MSAEHLAQTASRLQLNNKDMIVVEIEPTYLGPGLPERSSDQRHQRHQPRALHPLRKKRAFACLLDKILYFS